MKRRSRTRAIHSGKREPQIAVFMTLYLARKSNLTGLDLARGVAVGN